MGTLGAQTFVYKLPVDPLNCIWQCALVIIHPGPGQQYSAKSGEEP